MIPWWVCLIIGISTFMLGGFLCTIVIAALAGTRFSEMEARYQRALRLRDENGQG